MKKEKVKKSALTGGQRNYGIDFLRIVSMVYVIILHTFRHGGIMAALEVDTPGFIANWFLQILAFGAVDIFALISGYVSYSEKDRPVKYSNYITMWLQVVFYGVALGLIYGYFMPDAVTKSDFIKMFFPVTNSLYWYFTAYTGLFFLIPFINAGIRNSSDRNLKALFAFLFVVFSLTDIITNRHKLGGGYSFVWLLILYIMGAIIRKCGIGKRLKSWVYFLGIVLVTTMGLLWKLYGAEFEIFSFKVDRNTFISYVSPLILVTSILHLIGFSRLRFCNFFNKIIAFFAPAAFAVYLLNTQYFVWNNSLKGVFAPWAEKEWYIMVGLVLGFTLAFVICAMLIDKVRIFAFRVLGINKLALLADKGINKLIDKLVRTEETAKLAQETEQKVEQTV